MAKTNQDAEEETIDQTVAGTASEAEVEPALGADDLAEVDGLKAPAQSVRETVAAVAQAAADKAAGGAATAPAHWKDEDKKFFNGLKDRAVQDYLVKFDKERQAGATKSGMELAELKKQHEPIVELFKPYAEKLRSTGQSIAQVVGNYLRVEEALRAQPLETFIKLAAKYNITPEHIVEAMKGGAADPDAATDPLNDPLVKPLNDRLSRLEQAEKDRTDRAAREQEQTLGDAVAKFQTAKNAGGVALYPHATKPEIQRLMSVFIASGEVKVEPSNIDKALQRAYEKAIRADDGTHQELLKNAVEGRAKTEADARAERARKARTASSSISGGSSSAASPGVRRGSIRDQLGAAAESAGYTT